MTRRPNVRHGRGFFPVFVAPVLLLVSTHGMAHEPAGARRIELIRLVREDCGACHGMNLTGGLGPALTPEALRGKPVERIAASIGGGLPGTPMPPWQQFLSTEETRWIAERLIQGFPR